MKRNGRSIGELISSITFFVGAIWLGLEANLFFEQNEAIFRQCRKIWFTP